MLRIILHLFLFIFFISACTPEYEEYIHTEREFTLLGIRLQDSPVDYEEVNIHLKSIHAFGENEREFVELGVNAGIYNLLEYQNGLDTLISNSITQLNELRQLRLILGDSNSVKINGELFDLKVPSGSQSGLKIKACIDLTQFAYYEIQLDFVASRSVKCLGNGNFLMTPVVKVLNNDATCPEEEDEEEEATENPVNIEDLPASLRDFLDTNYPNTDFTAFLTRLCNNTEGYLVKVMVDEETVELFFDLEGNFLQMSRKIRNYDLPSVILQSIENDFSAYDLKNKSREITLANGETQYEVYLRGRGNDKKEIIFDLNGNINCEY